MTLATSRQPFDHPDFISELKYDGFRALAYVQDGRCDLVSRNNHVYKSYAALKQRIGEQLRVRNAILDGELVCIDDLGRPQFHSLLYRRKDPCFVAFDLLWINGLDLREYSLLDRKATLRTILPRNGPILFAEHVEGQATDLFREACRNDLEGIVAKYKWGAYKPDPGLSSWVKVKNPVYSQAVGRREQFQRFRRLHVSHSGAAAPPKQFR